MKLEVKEIRKSFGDTEILHGITFEVESGVALGLLVTKHVSSANQLADIFTKPVPKAALSYFRNKLCLQPRLSLRGDSSNLQSPVSNNRESISQIME